MDWRQRDEYCVADLASLELEAGVDKNTPPDVVCSREGEANYGGDGGEKVVPGVWQSAC